MADSARRRGKSRKQRPVAAAFTTDELRVLVDRSCREHDDQANQALEANGPSLAPVVFEMLKEDFDQHDETRGEFAAWLLADLMIFDLLRHPDEHLLINWFGIPPFPTATEEGAESYWTVESQPLAEALTLEQMVELWGQALQSPCNSLRKRAARAWQAVDGISGTTFNPRGTTLRRRFETFRAALVEALTLELLDDSLEARDAAEWALDVCRT